jgi:uncharacterized Fe-S cluster protein YjdI
MTGPKVDLPRVEPVKFFIKRCPSGALPFVMAAEAIEA